MPAGQSALPTKNDQEFKPFVRRLPEFKFWHAATRAVALAFACCWSEIFNLPVFWPVLVVYWLILVFLTMRKQIQAMVKYRYVRLVREWWDQGFDFADACEQVRAVGFRQDQVRCEVSELIILGLETALATGAYGTGSIVSVYAIRAPLLAFRIHDWILSQSLRGRTICQCQQKTAKRPGTV